jgi:ABC-type Fe3+-siderophore transport system permease subunit
MIFKQKAVAPSGILMSSNLNKFHCSKMFSYEFCFLIIIFVCYLFCFWGRSSKITLMISFYNIKLLFCLIFGAFSNLEKIKTKNKKIGGTSTRSYFYWQLQSSSTKTNFFCSNFCRLYYCLLLKSFKLSLPNTIFGIQDNRLL